MASASRSLLLICALLLVCLIAVATPKAASAPCPAPVFLEAFRGTAEFNNTVRAQMWVNDAAFFGGFPGSSGSPGGSHFPLARPTWWGAFSDASSGIYFYKKVGNEFVKGDFIDGNFLAGKPDTLWNGRELFILIYQSGSLAKLYKYRYFPPVDLPSFQRFPAHFLIRGFPVDLPLAGLANEIALHQDSTGKLWATYTSGTNVHVIWSTSHDHKSWNTKGMILASDVADFTDEAATIMHFDGNKIGVVWSNRALGEIGFSFHVDGETAWSPKEIVDCCQGFPDPKRPGRLKEHVADHHLSLRAAPDGRLFLVARDSIGKGRLHLYIRSLDGQWGQKTIVNRDPEAEPTRQTLVLDTENQHAYVIYRNSSKAGPEGEFRDDRIYLSRTSMDDPAFDASSCLIETPPLGPGRLNNVTSTKQNVNGTTDLVTAATREGQIFSSMLDLTSTRE